MQINNLSAIFKIPELKQKVGYVLLMIVAYRLGSHIPIAGVDLEQLGALFQNGGLLGFFNLFSGGALARFSIFALGILPYINASIIMQLLTIISPSMKEMSSEGEAGRKKIGQYTRYLAIGLAFVQASFMTVGFKSLMIPGMNFAWFFSYSVISLVAGAALVMWMSELITENGIGNGASILIFVGIVAQMPSYIKNTLVLVQGGGSLIGVMLMILVFLAMILSIVYVQEAERKVPVQYAKRVVGRRVVGSQNTYIPLRLVQGGVMPIIFASAVLQFPLMIVQYINIEAIQHFFASYYAYDGFIYNATFCVLIFFFTYFYTAITFNPEEIAENIRKHGGFIMGVRPGKSTVEFLERVITKLTLIGAVFLAGVALVPTIAANLTHVTSFMGLGGTALLIIVGVAMDLMKQIEAFVISKRYEGMM